LPLAGGFVRRGLPPWRGGRGAGPGFWAERRVADHGKEAVRERKGRRGRTERRVRSEAFKWVKHKAVFGRLEVFAVLLSVPERVVRERMFRRAGKKEGDFRFFSDSHGNFAV